MVKSSDASGLPDILARTIRPRVRPASRKPLGEPIGKLPFLISINSDSVSRTRYLYPVPRWSHTSPSSSSTLRWLDGLARLPLKRFDFLDASRCAFSRPPGSLIGSKAPRESRQDTARHPRWCSAESAGINALRPPLRST